MICHMHPQDPQFFLAEDRCLLDCANPTSTPKGTHSSSPGRSVTVLSAFPQRFIILRAGKLLPTAPIQAVCWGCASHFAMELHLELESLSGHVQPIGAMADWTVNELRFRCARDLGLDLLICVPGFQTLKQAVVTQLVKVLPWFSGNSCNRLRGMPIGLLPRKHAAEPILNILAFGNC